MKNLSENPGMMASLDDSQLDVIVGGWSLFPHPDIHVIRWKDGVKQVVDIRKYKDGEYRSDKGALEALNQRKGSSHTDVFYGM